MNYIEREYQKNPYVRWDDEREEIVYEDCTKLYDMIILSVKGDYEIDYYIRILKNEIRAVSNNEYGDSMCYPQWFIINHMTLINKLKNLIRSKKKSNLYV